MEHRRLACIIIAGGKRAPLIDDHILPSVRACDEVVVVGLHHEGEDYRYLHVPDLTKTTTDALIKRDVGTLVTTSDLLLYLCDDHRILGGIEEVRMDPGLYPWHVLIPQRFTEHPERGRIRINNGETQGYCGGHGGLYRRSVVLAMPWSTQPHHRLWDLYASKAHQRAGYKYIANSPLLIEDLEPHAKPWQ